MTPARPIASIVSAVYNVERYLDEFIASIEAQRVDPGAIEVIAVDDGSTDGSLDVLEAWASRGTVAVTVLHQENAGQASARNAGLRVARGTWVTFTDPDDKLDAGVLDAVLRFTDEHPQVDVVGALPVLFDEIRGAIRPVHPRTAQFRVGSRVVDLDREPNAFPGSATVSWFRLDRVRAQGLEFDAELRPNFEDQHFTARFLLGLERPAAGLVRGARYLYRKRLASDSTMQQSHVAPGRYTTVLQRGYLDLLTRARGTEGAIPAWVQHVVIYDLSKLFRDHDRSSTKLAVPDDVAPRFHALLEEIIGCLDPDVVYAHSASRLTPSVADVLAHAFPRAAWRPGTVAQARLDRVMGLQQIVYRHGGERPVEEVTQRGLAITPAWSKTRSCTYFGRPMLGERILWVPSDDVSVTLDGSAVEVGPPWTPPQVPGAPRPTRRRLRRPHVRGRLDELREHTRVRCERLLARTVYRQRFHDAWVVMDRVNTADDNGERLFEYLRSERRDVNAWFVLEQGVPDWERLRSARTERLVAHGSLTWRMLMLNATWLLASDAYAAIVRPKAILELTDRVPWRFGFLQHGVIKDDLSTWLNTVEMDLFVVSTEMELASIVSDGTGYVFTGRETRLTGLPRFDRLLRKAAEVAPDEIDLVLVAPTWRSWLTMPLASGASGRDLREAFWDSAYVRNWMAILGSPEIAEAVAARGWRLAFMPHPHFQKAFGDLALPPHVEPLTFARTDVQALYARCALLVTDYSSVAFNTAYLDRPAVYYQFDRDAIELGRHIGRKGYFEYERDGFGPVALDHDAAVAAIVASIADGPVSGPPYRDRIRRTFPNRDGDACARVVAAVEDLSRPWVPPS